VLLGEKIYFAGNDQEKENAEKSWLERGVTSRLGTTHIYRRLSRKSNARKNAGGCGKGHGNYL
jgi:hypothetical protein